MTDTDRYQPGEVVDLGITGAIVAFTHEGKTGFRIGNPDADEEHRDMILIHADWPQITISRGTPADGEPEPGDVWHDAEDALYLAGLRGGEVVFYRAIEPGNRICCRWQEIHAGPTGPIRLEYRPLPARETADDGKVKTCPQCGYIGVDPDLFREHLEEHEPVSDADAAVAIITTTLTGPAGTSITAATE